MSHSQKHLFSLKGKGRYDLRPLLPWVGAALIGLAAMLLGICAAAAARLFALGCGRVFWWPFVAVPVGGIFLTWFMKRVGPGTEGSGIQQAVAAMQVADSPARVHWFVNLRLTAAKFAALVLGTGAGFVVGLEGPTVQIGAGILSSFRRFMPQDNAILRRQLVMAGGAAGIAAAFSAPLAGLMFAFEEMGHNFAPRGAARTAIAVVLSGTVAFVVSGRTSYFGEVVLVHRPTPFILLILSAVMVAGALTGGAFSWLALRTGRWMPRAVNRFRLTRPYAFAIICGLVIAVCGLFAPVFGSGADLTRHMLHGEASVAWYYAPLKGVSLLATCLAGIPGGIFAPSLSLGAGVGSWFLPLASSQWHGEILAIGMVSVLAAATRAPLTAAFIMIEMTNGHAMVLEMLAAAILAAQIARRFHVHFYHELAYRALRVMPDSFEEDRPPASGPPKRLRLSFLKKRLR